MNENKALSSFQILLMAVAAGVAVANIYYNQPILKEIASTFHATEGQVGLISMLSQIGYGLGLFFITPLGDKVNKKNLILILLVILFVTLFLMAVSGSIYQLWVLSVLIGLLSVSVQVIVPMAATLDPVNRGKTVGTIFTGILIGILAARVFSGFIAEWLGWRYVYGFSAVMVFTVTVLLKIYLPEVGNVFIGSYRQLLGSALQQIKRFPLLRETALIGALQFGLFCSFWTTLTFHLSGAPFYFHSDRIGLFGLVAIAGAAMAPVFGKMADRGNANRTLVLTTLIIIFSVVLLKLMPGSVIALILAVLLLDMGAQGMQVTNVALIYTLDATSHSRINTIYMTSFFIGGPIGTSVGLFCWQHGGWNLVTWQLLLWACLVLVLVLRKKKPEQAPVTNESDEPV
jgi:predicted MFS family arabinose efflux permease